VGVRAVATASSSPPAPIPTPSRMHSTTGVVAEELVDQLAPDLADRPQQVALDRAELPDPGRHRVDRAHVVDVVDVADGRVVGADHGADALREAQDELGADGVADGGVTVVVEVDRVAQVAVVGQHAVVGEGQLAVQRDRLVAPGQGQADGPARLLGVAQQAVVVALDVVDLELAGLHPAADGGEERRLAGQGGGDDALDGAGHADVVAGVVRPLPTLEPGRRAHQVEHVADETQLGRAVATRGLDAGPEPLELVGLADDAAVQRIRQVDVADTHQQRPVGGGEARHDV
jgi:hypothetical protein